MCKNCNYQDMLETTGLEATTNRLRVLETLGNSNEPLTAAHILKKVEIHHPINKVTVYRILDILVAKKLLERLSTGTRTTYFGMAPNKHHAPHPHFFCTACGKIKCLSSESVHIDTTQLSVSSHAQIKRIEIRIEGICERCIACRNETL